MDLAELGFRIDSTGAVKGAADLDRLTAASGRAELAANKVGIAATTAGIGAARGGGNFRMFSQQLSQVAQQGAATGQWMQALTIQAADIGMAFGTVGAIVGTVATVALPALISALGGTSAGAAEAAAQVRALKDAQDALAEATSTAQTAIDKAIYGVDEAYQVELLKEQVRLQKERQAVYDEMVRTAATFGNDERARNQYIADTMVKIGQIEASYAKISADLSAQQNRAAQLAIIEGQRAQHAAEVGAQTDLAKAAADALQRSMANAYAVYASTRSEATALANETQRAAAAFQAAQQAIADKGMVYGQIGARGDPRTANQQGYGRFVPPDITSGGGGGGATDDFAQRLATLTEDLQTEREVLDEWYAESQALLADRRAEEILGEQAHRAALLAVETEYQEKLRAIRDAEASARLSDTADLFGSLASIAELGGKKQAKTAATLAAISTTVNGYAAAMDAARLAPTLAGKIAAYAGWIATTGRAVMSIRSAGGISGGANLATPAAQGGGAASEQTITVYGIDREGVYTGAFFERIFDGLFGVASGRNVRVSFG